MTDGFPRVGIGFDVHPFTSDSTRPLVLGGVTFAGAPGLDGHSDADAVCHAAADALLGAAGLGDLGQHFPDTDPQWRDADSVALLREVADRVRAAGFVIGNVDCTVLAESPKIEPARAEMERNLSSAAGAAVSVKATRPEGLGALGRGEGVSCVAVALLIATNTSE